MIHYALKLVRIAVLATITTVLTSLFNITLHPMYGYRALALSTSVGAAVNLLVLLLVFRRRYRGPWQPEMVLAPAWMTAAAAVMGLVLWALAPLLLGPAVHAAGLGPGPERVPLWRAIGGPGVLTGVGGLAYVGCVRADAGRRGQRLARRGASSAAVNPRSAGCPAMRRSAGF